MGERIVSGMSTMNEMFDRLEKIGIIPVVVIHRVEDAKDLARALIDGGLPCAEVTFRTEAAPEAIRIISEDFPDMLVGAGTVLTPEQVDQAVEAGARFIVSPGFNPKVVDHCLMKGIPCAPGCANPTDVEMALEKGLRVVKFFPAEPLGGLKLIKAIAAPYTGVRFLPTGGIHAGNVKEYLAWDRILACGGSWMVKGELIQNGEFDKIRELTKEAADLVKIVRGEKNGIESETRE